MRLAVTLALLVAAFFAFRYFTTGGESTTPQEAVTAIHLGANVLDVRTAGEYERGHVAGARNVSIMDPAFKVKVEDLPRDQPVYVYCGTGHRSGRAASILEGMGFERVVNAGGIGDLEAAGAEVVR